MKTKFKVGDKVVMVNPEIADDFFAPAHRFPKVGTISMINVNDEEGVVRIQEDVQQWNWPVEALELYKD